MKCIPLPADAKASHINVPYYKPKNEGVRKLGESWASFNDRCKGHVENLYRDNNPNLQYAPKKTKLYKFMRRDARGEKVSQLIICFHRTAPLDLCFAMEMKVSRASWRALATRHDQTVGQCYHGLL